MRRRISLGLAVVDARAMREAIAEFDERGRAKFLRRYGFSRSSTFYLIFGQRLYDTKALVAAAYRHATRKALRHTEFAGGAQTQAVFVDSRVVYIGETVEQKLDQRLYQLRRSIRGKAGHSGGTTLRAKGYHRKRLWLAIRSFPLGYGLDDAFAQSFRLKLMTTQVMFGIVRGIV
jgi:hypothetical protein